MDFLLDNVNEAESVCGLLPVWRLSEPAVELQIWLCTCVSELPLIWGSCEAHTSVTVNFFIPAI